LLRNLEDLERGLAEMRRVTIRGGRVITLDIVRPAVPLWGPAFGVYFNRVVPAIGALVAGDRQAYTPRPQSLQRLVPAPALRRARAAGAIHGLGGAPRRDFPALRPRDDRASHRQRVVSAPASTCRLHSNARRPYAVPPYDPDRGRRPNRAHRSAR